MRRRLARAIERDDLDDAHVLVPRHADARVDQRVEEVDEQVDDDVPDRDDEDDALEERVVLQAIESTVSRPKPAMPKICSVTIAPEIRRAELEADHGRHRDQAVAERVLADDRPLAQALARAVRT